MPHSLNHTHANRLASAHGYEGMQPQIFREPSRAELIALALMADHAERVRSQRPGPSAPRKFSWEV